LTGLLALSGVACRTFPELPPAELSEAGWQVLHGQATWQPPQQQSEITGELLCAIHENGDSVVQFAKPPFTIATARTFGDLWQIEFSAGERTWRGCSIPPTRFVWFQLPQFARKNALTAPWCASLSNGLWKLENQRTGEWLEGRFFP